MMESLPTPHLQVCSRAAAAGCLDSAGGMEILRYLTPAPTLDPAQPEYHFKSF